MGSFQGLSVRRHERHGAELRATVSLVTPSAEAVRFSTSSDIDGGAIPATLVDIGDGGLGLRSGCFLPRGAEVRITIHGVEGAVLLAAAGHVRRVAMVHRGPEYQMGVAFIGESASIVGQVAAVRAATGCVSGPGEASRGG